MTRRHFLGSMGLCVAGSAGCRAQEPQANENLRQWEDRNDLAILDISLDALSINGDRVGRLALPDCCFAEPAVAPDAACVGWIARSEVSVICTIGASSQVRTMHYSGRFGRVIGISSNAMQLAVVAMDKRVNRDWRLLSVGRREGDLTSLLTHLHPMEIERLRLCGSGDQLAVGSRDAFVLIDLNQGKVMFEGTGRFPTPSPDGENLAFVNAQGNLVCRKILSGNSRRLRRGSKIFGVGAWSPDGRYLLVGERMPYSIWKRLQVVDVVEDQAWDSFKLGEGDYGNRCVWVSRQLISI